MTDRAPAFQWYPKDYESDEHVKLMTLEQEGAYVRLLNHAWLEGSVPADVSALARICRVPTAKMARLWSGVKPCWKDAGDGRMVNGRQERDRAKQEAFRAEKSRSGKRGAEAKHAGRATISPEQKDGTATVSPVAKSSSPYSVSVLRTPVERTNERSNPPTDRARDVPRNGDGPKRNPLVQANRDEWEVESMRLTQEIRECRLQRHLAGQTLAPDEPTDGAEIFVAAAKYEGALRQKCNPANMTDDRLLNTVLDLRATAQAEREKAGKIRASA